MKPISDSTLTLLSKVLDLHAAKEKVIASNIANAETPGYSAKKFTFENQLKHAVTGEGIALTTTQQGHIPLAAQNIEDITGTIIESKDTTGIGDLNSVSLDEEMLALSENELQYETAAQLLKKKLTIQKYVISGGQ